MNFRFTIGKKLSFGFGLLIIAILFNGILTFSTLKRSKSINEKVAKIYTPSITNLKDLNLLIIRSKTLTSTWLDEDSEDASEKSTLKKLHDYEYPALRKELKGLIKKWEFQDQLIMDSIFNQVDSIIEVQHEIMITFSTEESYWIPSENVDKRHNLKKSFDNGEVDNIINNLLIKLNKVIKTQENYADMYSEDMRKAFEKLQNYILYLGIVLVLGGILIAYFTIKSIITPINQLREILLVMGKGILDIGKIEARKDEIGEMTSALNELVEGLKRTSGFAKKIGEGVFNSTYHPLSEQDTLGNSLLIMRENLAQVAEEDRKRNWTTEGLAKFGELLRRNNDNVKKLSETLISELVKYLNANQGGIFILNNENDSETYMQLLGCYAWDRHRFIDERVHIGDGLVGQSWQEKSTLYITDVPEGYIRIESGLGDSNPTCILIVPIKLNEEVYGVIEIASFAQFEQHQIEFAERLAETIASSISSVRSNERTKFLLEQAQTTSEQMRSQEEELRQNQIELERKQRDMERTIEDYKVQLIQIKKQEDLLKEENQVLQNLLLKTTKDLERLKSSL